jgi:exoribonuclease-2
MSDQKNSLLEIARLAMTERGLEADFSESAQQELAQITTCAKEESESMEDLTHLLWCSIDNDDSMDLDQLTVTEKLPSGHMKLLVAIADVDALVKIGSHIDLHAKKNTTSVYTGVAIFPMLPEKLSTDLTSLSEGEVRIAMVMEMELDPSGATIKSRIYRARVKNQAKLTYNSVSEWIEGKGPLPKAAKKISGMQEQLRLQDHLAQKMRCLRYEHGALELETLEPRAIMKEGTVVDLQDEPKNRAKELIEDFMIAANGVTAKFLTQSGYPTLRRVVRSPERWARIMQVAEDLGEHLPPEPSSKALGQFLSRRRSADLLTFPDLSLTVVKLLGRGEYILVMPGEKPIGHFGLAVKNYTHSTAPNRRFPDLITLRLLKAALKNAPPPYDKHELGALAAHCTLQENAADRVERQVRKSAAAELLSSRIGNYFHGIVTGASEKGTWVRIFHPPVEGKIVHGQRDLDVGQKVRVKLLHVNIERGFIDFVRV